MSNEWLADVGGQIAAGVSIAVLGGIAGLFTPWGKRLAAKAAEGVSRVWRTVRSIRVTTRPRIDAEIADAVTTATAPSDDEDDDAPRTPRPDEYEGWVLGPASEPRHWELRNQTRETVTVEAIHPAGGSYWPFEWEEPDLPMRVAPGESVLIRARRLRGANSFMPWMNETMANVLYEDEHGDEQEDIIWVLE